MKKNALWYKLIPWYMTIICLVALFFAAIFLYLNLEWFKASAIDNKELMDNIHYRHFIYSNHLSILKRSLGIITGIAIAFIGMGAAFYAIENSTEMEVTGFGKIASYSPGLLAIFLGCFLIFMSINSKDTFEFSKMGTSENTSNLNDTTNQERLVDPFGEMSDSVKQLKKQGLVDPASK